METRNVFIDTQSFVKAGLHFENSSFNSFIKYCAEKELSHLSTTVVVREVKSHIRQSVGEAISSIKAFRKKARILSPLNEERVKGLFEHIPDDFIYEKSEEMFEVFLDNCSTMVLDAGGISAEDVLSLYFDKRPPFGDGKKKSEFPDAISMLCLKKYADANEDKIYIVSEDKDLEAFCEHNDQFILVKSLSILLDIYTTFTNARIEQVKQYFIDNVEEVKQNIKESLEDCDVYNISSWEDAEVEGGLKVLKIGDIEPSVLSIDDEQSQVSFDIDVEFEVEVIGPDFNNGIYDREDGRVYTFGSTSRSSTISRTFTVELLLNYESVDGTLVGFWEDNLHIEGVSGGIEVSVEENEDPDWY